MKFLGLLFLIGCATANIHQGQEEEERNLADIWEKVKDINYFGIDIKENNTKFEEWVKNTFKDRLDKGENEIENIKPKDIAIEFIENAENVSKEVAHEAKDSFRKHKGDLGGLWSRVKYTVHKIIKPHKTN